MAVTVRQNIERVLSHLGLSDAVIITMEDEDRVWGWPVGDKLHDYVMENGWERDCSLSVAHFHGEGGESFREPQGCHPAMQIVFHAAQDTQGPFVEIDLDEAAPVDVVSGIWHLKEVIVNAITGRRTNQQYISRLLDKRFGV